MIVKQGEHPLQEIRAVRKGVVELVERGRVLDLLEASEMFGQAWSFSGLPTPVEARAWEDTLCYVLPSDEVVPFLSSRAGVSFRRSLAVAIAAAGRGRDPACLRTPTLWSSRRARWCASSR